MAYYRNAAGTQWFGTLAEVEASNADAGLPKLDRVKITPADKAAWLDVLNRFATRPATDTLDPFQTGTTVNFVEADLVEVRDHRGPIPAPHSVEIRRGPPLVDDSRPAEGQGLDEWFCELPLATRLHLAALALEDARERVK